MRIADKLVKQYGIFAGREMTVAKGTSIYLGAISWVCLVVDSLQGTLRQALIMQCVIHRMLSGRLFTRRITAGSDHAVCNTSHVALLILNRDSQLIVNPFIKLITTILTPNVLKFLMMSWYKLFLCSF